MTIRRTPVPGKKHMGITFKDHALAHQLLDRLHGPRPGLPVISCENALSYSPPARQERPAVGVVWRDRYARGLICPASSHERADTPRQRAISACRASGGALSGKLRPANAWCSQRAAASYASAAVTGSS